MGQGHVCRVDDGAPMGECYQCLALEDAYYAERYSRTGSRVQCPTCNGRGYVDNWAEGEYEECSCDNGFVDIPLTREQAIAAEGLVLNDFYNDDDVAPVDEALAMAVLGALL